MSGSASELEVRVVGAAGEPGRADVLSQLVKDRVASGIAVRSATLWGPDAASEASIRLGWVDLSETSRPLLAQVEALRAELAADGIDHVVLCGMGGSSLAPEVITRSAGVELTVLDSTDPGVIGRTLADRLDRTVVVVSSKSGTTVETDSQRLAYLHAFESAGLDGPRHLVAVTDPGSQLAAIGERDEYRAVFRADPDVGGRYSALTAFGLVPSGLAGVDLAELLDDAEEVREQLTEDSADNPALVLAAALGAAHEAGGEKVVLGQGGSATVGFPAWAEQLIAESTGKQGRGLLPVDVGPAAESTPGWGDAGSDATRVAIGSTSAAADLVTDGGLGALFLTWETAIAAAGRVIGINPFDQPNVEEAKKQARSLLDDPGAGDGLTHAFTEGAVEVYADPQSLRGSGDLSLGSLFADVRFLVPEAGYLALQAYLDRDADASAVRLRDLVAAATGLQTTFGWGPRFLHSTGQYHKGGHPNGGFLQITGDAPRDISVPERPYTFGQLQRAQAAGDARVLHERGRPVVRLHLTERPAGLSQLLGAAERARSRTQA